MKVMTILGTRPEIIRLSRIIPKLDKVCDHIIVNTGQNFDPKLNAIFFDDLKIREPDYNLGIQGKSFGDQAGKIIIATEGVMLSELPDRLLILGDTNSGLSAIPAKKLGIPVYHMEAGNRCYDDRVPEEVNRRIIDHSSDILMPYTERSRMNLLKEGIEGHRIFVTGNPIFEVIQYYKKSITQSTILKQLKLTMKNYILITVHRAENVDDKVRLTSLITAFDRLQKKYKMPLIISFHPHTRKMMDRFSIHITNPDILFLEPFSFFDFITLEMNAYLMISDSGTVQEECCIFKIPNITIRDTTERPETIECGSNILCSVDENLILHNANVVLSQNSEWQVPPEYVVENVSDPITKIVMGYYKPQYSL